jgi:hypothetical protein
MTREQFANQAERSQPFILWDRIDAMESLVIAKKGDTVFDSFQELWHRVGKLEQRLEEHAKNCCAHDPPDNSLHAADCHCDDCLNMAIAKDPASYDVPTLPPLVQAVLETAREWRKLYPTDSKELSWAGPRLRNVLNAIDAFVKKNP